MIRLILNVLMQYVFQWFIWCTTIFMCVLVDMIKYVCMQCHFG